MNTLSRRRFLKTISQFSVFSFFAPAILRASALNERIQVGFIGTGPMGRNNCRNFAAVSDLVALCDLDERYGLTPALKDKQINVRKMDTYSDYRRILDRNDINLVGIATPDHWHIKIAVEALMAGKHVFCEKPLTLTVEEGTLIRNACKKYDRVFQVGTMQRSSKRFQTAVLIVRKGFLGQIKRVVCHIDGAPSSPPIPACPVPPTLDWNLWQGQAPVTEYIATEDILPNFGCPKNTRGHHEFRWFFDYAGGKFTDWGAHHVDIALWALQQDSQGQGAVKLNPVTAEHPIPLKDGMPTVKNRYQTASKFQINCTLPDGTVIEIVSHSPYKNGIFFEGTKGTMHVSRGQIKGDIFENDKVQESFTEEDYRSLYKGKKMENDNDMLAHKLNMIRCIKEGGLPVSDVYSHVQEINLCHTACIAARLGRELAWNPQTERFVDDEQANTFLAREQRKGFEIPRC
ncbi:MAG: Gfo/Idh/MocA family oxidoreductase [Planctomycetaceae bacterium]|jgi:predicted dehydrogenase|nr:Gfo/Idh/MocA family oxidoreductase [Planctomycetaceae bacterium]